jgi:hypothetical protein
MWHCVHLLEDNILDKQGDKHIPPHHRVQQLSKTESEKLPPWKSENMYVATSLYVFNMVFCTILQMDIHIIYKFYLQTFEAENFNYEMY